MRSVEIWNINRKNRIFYKNPEFIKPNNILELLWKFIFLFVRFVHRYIISRKVYDIKEEAGITEYKTYSSGIAFFGKLPKVVVYTCILGNYDKLHEPIYVNHNIDYYAICDFDIPKESTWNKIDIHDINNIKDLDNIKKARYIKMHPSEIFPDYDYSIWIDGNIIIMADIMPVIINMLASEKKIACHMHPLRNKLSTEGKAIVALRRKVDKSIMSKQIHDYYHDGYKDTNEILETTIIARKNNDKRVDDLMDCWWKQIIKYTTRDQLSLPYAMWLQDWDLSDILILGHNLRLNPRFIYIEHEI